MKMVELKCWKVYPVEHTLFTCVLCDYVYVTGLDVQLLQIWTHYSRCKPTVAKIRHTHYRPQDA
jgi:hypothetical protein